MFKGNCFHCGNGVYQDCETISILESIAHIECHEAFEVELEKNANDMAELQRSMMASDKKVLKHLKRVLKPKLWAAIKFTIEDHRYEDLKIVSIDSVKGSKIKASDWFGESVAMRYMYDDTSSDYWGDSYGGLIWLPIGKKRYLQMHVWG